jgi:molybdenum cofactor cytidylyltransferase
LTEQHTASTGIVAIVLAAGRGERFDPSGARYKLTALLPDGRPVVRATCERLLDNVERVIVVCNDARHQEIAGALRGLDVELKACARAHLGMGATLKHGIADVAHATGWLIALADMPHIQSTTIRRIRDALHNGAPIVRPLFRGREGHPVGFGSRCRDALLQLPDSQGALGLIRRETAHVLQIEVEDAGCVFDIDEPADLSAEMP